jgi:hypothetical protein
MVVGNSGNVEDNTGAGLKEGGQVHAVQAGRGIAPTMPRKLHFNRKQNTKSINVQEITDNIKQFLREFTIRNKSLVLSINLANNTIKIANEHRRHRPLQVLPQTAQHRGPLFHNRPAPPARRKVKVDEGEVPDGDELGITRCELPNTNRAAGQNGDGPLGRLPGSGKVGRVTIGSSQSRQRRKLGDFLYKGEVGAVITQEAGQTGEISYTEGVEGKDREERPRGLTIISTRRRHHRG